MRVQTQYVDPWVAGEEQERRLHPRILYATQVHFDGRHYRPARGVDISVGGIGFLTDDPPPIGMPVELTFLGRSVSVKGVVRNHRRCSEGHRVGVEFLTEEPDVVEVALRYC